MTISAALHRSRAWSHRPCGPSCGSIRPAGWSASYHLGWSDADGTPTVATGQGRAAGACAVVRRGGRWPARTGMPGAVAVELVHNFSLLHDDLMDRDAERRHRRTVWAVWGPSTAILVGDAMLALAYQVLRGRPRGGRRPAALLAPPPRS